MFTKRYGLRPLVFATALMLAACGGGGGDDDDDDDDDYIVDSSGSGGGGGGGIALPDIDFSRSFTAPPARITALEEAGEIPRLDRTPENPRTNPVTTPSGVRPDVEQYIVTAVTGAGVDTAAARQFARAVQAQMEVDPTNPVAVQDALNNTVRALSCIASRFPDLDEDDLPEITAFIRDIENVTANTADRAAASLDFSQALNGAVVSLGSITGGECDA